MTLFSRLKNLAASTLHDGGERERTATILFGVAVATVAGLCILIGYRFAVWQLRHVPTLLVAEALTLLVILLLRRNRLDLAGPILLWTYFGLANYMMWTEDGLHDTAVYALPALLVIAGLLWRARTFYLFLSACILSIVIMGVAEIVGVAHTPFSAKTNYTDIIDVAVIFSITSVIVRLLANNLLKSIMHARDGEREIRKQAEQLRESGERYQSLFEGANDAIFMMNDARIIDCNTMTPRLLGCAGGGEVIARTLWDFSPRRQADGADSKTKGREILRSVLDGTPQHFPWQLVRKNGVLFDAEISLKRLDTGKENLVQALVRDVTERKRAEQLVRASEEKYRALIETTDTGFVILDARGRVLDANDEYVRLTGRKTQTEILGKPVSAWTADHDTARNADEVTKCLEQGYVRNLEVDYISPSGVVTPVEVNATVLRTGEDTRIVSLCRDVTERKSAEQALRTGEERFRRLVESVTDYIYTVTLEGGRPVATSHGPGCIAVTGYTAAEYSADPYLWYRMIHEQDRDAVAALTETVLAGRDVLPLEHRIIHKDGYVRWVRNTPVLLRDDEGRLLSYEGLITDITERKEAELATQAAREYAENLVQTANTIVVSLDSGGQIVVFNRAAEEITGYTAAEMKSSNWFETLVPKDRYPGVHAEFERLSTGGLPKRFENPIVTKSGEERYIAWSNSQVYEQGRFVGVIAFGMDITDRQRAEGALQQSEVKFRSAFENAPVGMCLLSTDGRFLKVNESLSGMLGYSERELLSMTFRDVTHPDDLEDSARWVERMWKGEAESNELEKRYIHKDGHVVWGIVRTVLVGDHGNPSAFFLTHVQDITRRKQAEKALSQSEEKFSKAFHSSPTYLALSTLKDGRILEVNEGLERVTGYRREEFIGRTTVELGLWANDAERARFLRTLEKEGKVRNHEVCYKARTGELIFGLVSADPVDLSGERCLLTVIQDISDRKRAEKALLESEELHRKLVAAVPDVIVRTDLAGNIVFVNEPSAAFWGYAGTDGIPGRSIFAFIAPEDRDRAMENIHLMLQRQQGPREYRVFAADGAARECEVNGDVLRSADGTPYGIVLVIRDITARKQAEEERKRLETQLLQAQRMESIGTLAAGIAHDFNNILNIVLGNANLLAGGTGDREKLSRRIEAITKATERGAHLVKQLLTFARKTGIEWQSVAVNELIQDMVKLLEETFPRTIDVTLQLERNLPIVMGDLNQLHQVLVNLCVNSRDAMSHGGKLSIATRSVDGKDVRNRYPRASAVRYVCIAVNDTGTGMDDSTQKRIFDPFFTTKEKGKGTGLGLAVAMGIVDSHGGFIEVDSSVGEGTEFRLYFPAVEQMKGTKTEIEAEVALAPGGSETILFIEDEALARELVAEFLGKKGYTVLTAGDGEEALAVFKEHLPRISLVLSDLGLPKIDGEELYKRIRAMESGVPFVLTSGFVDPERKTALTRMGVEEFFPKPYRLGELLVRVRDILDRKARP